MNSYALIAGAVLGRLFAVTAHAGAAWVAAVVATDALRVQTRGVQRLATR